MPSMKGEPVRFIAGTYAGKKGWFNTNEIGDELWAHVIVDRGPKGDKVTKVWRSSIKNETNEEPASYAEAVLNQCPDIEIDLVKVSPKLAKCDIRRDEAGFSAVVHTKLSDPGVPNTTSVTQETDQSYGLFKSFFWQNLSLLMQHWIKAKKSVSISPSATCWIVSV